MNRQIALAYAIAGLSAAIATVVVVGTTVGFDAPSSVAAPSSGDLLAQADDAPARVASAPAAAPAPVAARPSEPAPVKTPRVVEEVVYVDETGAPLVGSQPVRAVDDEDEDDEHEAAHEDEDEDDDDDRHGRRRAHRRDHDDD